MYIATVATRMARMAKPAVTNQWPEQLHQHRLRGTFSLVVDVLRYRPTNKYCRHRIAKMIAVQAEYIVAIHSESWQHVFTHHLQNFAMRPQGLSQKNRMR